MKRINEIIVHRMHQINLANGLVSTIVDWPDNTDTFNCWKDLFDALVDSRLFSLLSERGGCQSTDTYAFVAVGT